MFIFTGISAMSISKWDIVVIRAHHWIWEEMYALEAPTIPFNWLEVFTFTGATFLYTKMDFTAVIKEKACKFGFF